MRYFRFFALMVLLVFTGQCCYAQNTAPKEEWPAYICAFFLGFGTGHFYLGDRKAINFLIGEIAGIGIAAGGFIFIYFKAASYDDPYQIGEDMSVICGGYSIVLLGTIVILVSRLCEIIDIFRAVDQAKAEGKIANFKPVIDIQPAKTFFGISYKF